MALHDNSERPRCDAAPKVGALRQWPCKNFPMHGEKRCHKHGGAHKGHAAKVAAMKLQSKIDRAVRKLDISPVGDPLTALSLLAGEVLAWKDEMARHVGMLHSIRYSTDTAEQTRAEVTLFERAMDRCATVLVQIAKLNIDERLAAITEQQATMLTNALFAAFDEAGFSVTDVDKKKAVTGAFSRHLRLVG